MQYHVITPMNRFENLKPLMKLLEPQGVIWHIIVDWQQPFRLHFQEKWIVPYVNEEYVFTEIRHKNFWERCNSSINQWMDDHEWMDDHYYCILNDDDAYEPGFFDKMLNHRDADVIIPSMMRGHHIPSGISPERAHGTDTLEAKPENMQVGRIGVEQLIVKGKVLKHCRLPLTIAGDGEMICFIAATNPVKYVPDAFVWFNYLEPGRWDK